MKKRMTAALAAASLLFAIGVSGIMLYGAATIGEALKLAMPREERG